MVLGLNATFADDDPAAAQVGAEARAKAGAPSDGETHIIEGCFKNKDIRSLFRRGDVFCRLREEKGEPPINTSYDNLEKRREDYRAIERFGVENRMALRGVTNQDNRRSTAFRATYANMQADRIYQALPYGKLYLRMIMAFYSVSRLNFGRLFQYQLMLLVGTAALCAAVTFFWRPENALMHYGFASGGILALFALLNAFVHTLYKNAAEVNRTTVADKVGERIYHLITAEQACLSRITTEENSAENDADWKQRAEIWALAAVAFRWRVFMLKQFLDIATHKILRRYVWLHNFTIPFIIVPLFISLVAFVVLATHGTIDWFSAQMMLLSLLGASEGAFFFGGTVLIAGAMSYFFWSANPAETLNLMAARIGYVDDGADLESPIDIILHLVGRVSTAKNEGRRS